MGNGFRFAFLIVKVDFPRVVFLSPTTLTRSWDYSQGSQILFNGGFSTVGAIIENEAISLPGDFEPEGFPAELPRARRGRLREVSCECC